MTTQKRRCGIFAVAMILPCAASVTLFVACKKPKENDHDPPGGIPAEAGAYDHAAAERNGKLWGPLGGQIHFPLRS